MFDYESKVFSSVKAAVVASYTACKCYGTYESIQESFPCLILVQTNQVTFSQNMDGTDSHDNLTFQLDVYSNSASGKKKEAKAITAIADEKMQSMGFRRTMLQPTQNLFDSSIYRITARYERLVSGDGL